MARKTGEPGRNEPGAARPRCVLAKWVTAEMVTWLHPAPAVDRSHSSRKVTLHCRDCRG